MLDILSITKALANGSRLRALMALTSHEQLCACQIIEMLQLAPATVSRHMSVLQHAGLVANHKDGRWVYYHLSKQAPGPLVDWLKESLKSSADITADRVRLQEILASLPDDLCRARRNACP